MAIAIDASTPLLVSATADPYTTASFTPPSGALLVVAVMCDAFSGTPTVTVSSTGMTFTKQATSGEASGNNGTAQIFTGVTPDGSARTVSATSANLANDDGAIKVWVVTGADTSNPVDATASGSSTTNNINPTVTVATNGSWVFGCADEWQSLGVPTSTDSGEGWDTADNAGIAVRKAASSNAGSVSLNFNAAGNAAATWNYVLVAIKPASTGTNASAELAGGIGAANQPAGHHAESAAGDGAANQPAGHHAEVAAGTGTAIQPGGHHVENPNATGVANQPAGHHASGSAATGVAFNATVSTSSSTNAPAGLASGTGTANPTAGHHAEAGTASGIAGQTSGHHVEATFGTGAANNAAVSTSSSTNALAGVASGSGMAGQTAGHHADSATGFGAAQPTAQHYIGIALGTGTITQTGGHHVGVASVTGSAQSTSGHHVESARGTAQANDAPLTYDPFTSFVVVYGEVEVGWRFGDAELGWRFGEVETGWIFGKAEQ